MTGMPAAAQACGESAATAEDEGLPTGGRRAPGRSCTAPSRLTLMYGDHGYGGQGLRGGSVPGGRPGLQRIVAAWSELALADICVAWACHHDGRHLADHDG